MMKRKRRRKRRNTRNWKEGAGYMDREMGRME
jgi:hypothetical protein